ncbi:uncharacterized protein LOC124607098 [Schistocerca americana]|uniref:uncharacterized protein LOC124607098 n=1 Tax=Schistocerca americana TaxID=7009 RepID=UPI001F4FE5A9|nr:uncharacterized protein LOC124607098 [Schistocerca americana]
MPSLFKHTCPPTFWLMLQGQISQSSRLLPLLLLKRLKEETVFSTMMHTDPGGEVKAEGHRLLLLLLPLRWIIPHGAPPLRRKCVGTAAARSQASSRLCVPARHQTHHCRHTAASRYPNTEQLCLGICLLVA